MWVRSEHHLGEGSAVVPCGVRHREAVSLVKTPSVAFSDHIRSRA